MSNRDNIEQSSQQYVAEAMSDSSASEDQSDQAERNLNTIDVLRDCGYFTDRGTEKLRWGPDTSDAGFVLSIDEQEHLRGRAELIAENCTDQESAQRLVRLGGTISRAIERGVALDLEGIDSTLTRIEKQPSRQTVELLSQLIEMHIKNPERVTSIGTTASQDLAHVSKSLKLATLTERLDTELGFLLDERDRKPTIKAMQDEIGRELSSPGLTTRRVTELQNALETLCRGGWKRTEGQERPLLRERIGCILKIIEATRENPHLNIPLEKLLKAPIETLRFASERIAQSASSFRPPAAGESQDNFERSRAAMNACADHKVGGKNWMFIPAGNGSQSEKLKVNGVFINPETGEIAPVEWSHDFDADRDRGSAWGTPSTCNPESSIVESAAKSTGRVRSETQAMAEYLGRQLDHENNARLRMCNVSDFGKEQGKVLFPSMGTTPRLAASNQMLELESSVNSMAARNQETLKVLGDLGTRAKRESGRELIGSEIRKPLVEGFETSSILRGFAVDQPAGYEVRVDEGTGRKFLEWNLSGVKLGDWLADHEGLPKITHVRLHGDGRIQAIGADPMEKPIELGSLRELVAKQEALIARLPDGKQRANAMEALDAIRAISSENPLNMRSPDLSRHPAVAVVGQVCSRVAPLERAVAEQFGGDLRDPKFRLRLAAAETEYSRTASVEEAVKAVGNTNLPDFDLSMTDARRFCRLRSLLPQATGGECVSIMRLEDSLRSELAPEMPPKNRAAILFEAVALQGIMPHLSDREAVDLGVKALKTTDTRKTSPAISREFVLLQRTWGMSAQDAVSFAVKRSHSIEPVPTLAELFALGEQQGWEGKKVGLAEAECASDAALIRRDFDLSAKQAFEVSSDISRLTSEKKVSRQVALVAALLALETAGEPSEQIAKAEGFIKMRQSLPSLTLERYTELVAQSASIITRNQQPPSRLGNANSRGFAPPPESIAKGSQSGPADHPKAATLPEVVSRLVSTILSIRAADRERLLESRALNEADKEFFEKSLNQINTNDEMLRIMIEDSDRGRLAGLAIRILEDATTTQEQKALWTRVLEATRHHQSLHPSTALGPAAFAKSVSNASKVPPPRKR